VEVYCVSERLGHFWRKSLARMVDIGYVAGMSMAANQILLTGLGLSRPWATV
jgi:hypothetical protein